MTKQCKQCGFVKPVEEFRIQRSRHELMPIRNARCKVCEVTNRDKRKKADPYRPAFLQRRQHHASRYRMTVAELDAMGWDLERRCIEMRAQFENGFCPACIESDGTVHYFRNMTNGLAELTIDRIDTSQPPVWPGNVQWLCMTCNRRKQNSSPILHGQRVQAEHELRLGERGGKALEQLSLFGDLNAFNSLACG